MENSKIVFHSVDQYIASFPVEVQAILEELRAAIKAAVPDVEERISYQIPGYFRNGNLIHFAAYQKHIGMYPAPDGPQPFIQELLKYKSERSTLRFPIDEPLPLDLITELVKFRAAENLDLARAKANKKKSAAGKQKSQNDLPEKLSQPAQRALAAAGIQSLEQVSRYSAVEISKLHGIGPNAMALLQQALEAKGLSFSGEIQQSPK
jgi:uncharacterized protein YdhG (YjbR/CyaY superfamily)